MTLAEVKNMLEESGIPVAYRRAKQGTKVPFITWKAKKDNMSADDVVYHSFHDIEVWLYTTRKDLKLEDKLETIFKNHGIYWSQDDSDLDDENVMITIYTMEV